MAFPGARQQRSLYVGARRVRDELGKGQEILRSEKASLRGVTAAAARQIIFVPEVDVVIVDIVAIGEGMTAGDTVEVLAPALYDTAIGAANRLCDSMTNANLADNTLFRATLTGLNGNRVSAGQPVIMVATEVGGGTITEVTVQVSYILADDERTYSIEV